MKIPRGKSIYIWMVKEVHNGNNDPVGLAKIAKGMGLSSVWVKIADGTSRFNLRPIVDIAGITIGWKDDIVKPLVDAMHAQGIEVWGWHYIYGNDPVGEADLAVKRSLEMGVDGYIIDAEKEFEQVGWGAKANQFMDRLLDGFTTLNFPVGLSTWRFPTVHQPFPWKEFLPRIDFHAPQVYWVQANNPAEQLARSLNEYRNLENSLGISPLPYIPVGAAYREFLPSGSWQPAPEHILMFHNQALALGVPGESFWEWGSAIRYGLEDEVQGLVWPSAIDEPAEIAEIRARILAIDNRISIIDSELDKVIIAAAALEKELAAETELGRLRTDRIKAIEAALGNTSEILRIFGA